ncbi:unnamed protein product [Allacma fusca]|uniref:long-chain-fatty-acid--CoA ligase n=1 Tax=Allacma fusca TaxID=39272 RepID=A0A8J2KIJ1_9HEXA|nr:unnamed protein product [Allacma fusca]
MQFKIKKLYLPVVQLHTIATTQRISAAARIKPLPKCHYQRPQKSVVGVRWISNQLDKNDPSLAWKSSGKTFNQGPDQILPSTAWYTWEKDGATRINYGDCEMGKVPPVSIPTFLKNYVERNSNRIAIAVKIDGSWKKWTCEKYYDEVITVAKAFLALGLEKHHSVCIISSNRPEWFLSNFGAIFGGGVSTGIYTTNNAQAVAHCASDSSANILVVENEVQLAKVKIIQNQIPQLKSIVLIEGTTGKPKGVMLSHDNLAWTAQSLTSSLLLHVRRDCPSPRPLSIVSYLPLSHVAAQAADIYVPLSIPDGMGVYFGDKDSLKDTLVDTLREIRPVFFLGVPRVYEKIYDRIIEVREKNSGLKKFIADVAKSRATRYNQGRINGEIDPWVPGFKLCDKIILNKLKEQIGFENVKFFMSGAAPLSPIIIEYFLSLNIPIAQLYGLSETTGPSTTQHLNFFKVGSIGKGIPGVNAYIINPTEQGAGELVIGGRCVMMGYIGLKESTTNSFRKGSDFLTGDIGSIDEKGFITLSGRQKELIITAGGENVAPVEIEDRVKSELAIVSNAVIIGEGQKFLSLLLTLKTQLNPKTNEPTEELTEFVQKWVSVNGNLEAKIVADILGPTAIDSQHELRKAIQRRVDKVNSNAISHAQLIRNWCILPGDFSSSGGEFGPSMKLIRTFVNEKYTKTIQDLYHTKNAVSPSDPKTS